MKEYAPAQLVMSACFPHGGAGKTTLSEALLFAGAIANGSVDDGTPQLTLIRRAEAQMSVSLRWRVGVQQNNLVDRLAMHFYGEVTRPPVVDGELISSTPRRRSRHRPRVWKAYGALPDCWSSTIGPAKRQLSRPPTLRDATAGGLPCLPIGTPTG